MGSATPSVESMYNARIGKYELLELPERIDDAQLPEIKLVNVKIERKQKRMENIFSNALLKRIKERVDKKEGVIILQNRRGFATQVYCEDCGEIEMCKECSVGMVHHINKNILQCHYCGASRPVPKGCTTCGSLNQKFFGTGTQRVEDELDYYLPDINLERVDSDTINKKGKMGIILNNFRKGEIVEVIKDNGSLGVTVIENGELGIVIDDKDQGSLLVDFGMEYSIQREYYVSYHEIKSRNDYADN